MMCLLNRMFILIISYASYGRFCPLNILTPNMLLKWLYPLPSQNNERSCICVLELSVLSLYDISIIFWNCSESVVSCVFCFLHLINKWWINCSASIHSFIFFYVAVKLDRGCSPTQSRRKRTILSEKYMLDSFTDHCLGKVNYLIIMSISRWNKHGVGN